MYDDFLVVRNYGKLNAKFLLGTSTVIEKVGPLSHFLFLARTTTKIRLNLHFDDVRLQLHGTIYRPNSFVLMLRYCANLKAIRYKSTSLNLIVADTSHLVIVA